MVSKIYDFLKQLEGKKAQDSGTGEIYTIQNIHIKEIPLSPDSTMRRIYYDAVYPVADRQGSTLTIERDLVYLCNVDSLIDSIPPSAPSPPSCTSSSSQPQKRGFVELAYDDAQPRDGWDG